MSEIYDELDDFSGNDNFKGKNDINEVSDITSDLISTILSGKYNYTDLTGRFKAGENREDVPESIDTLKIALANSPDKIRAQIVDYVNSTKAYSGGQQGEVYKYTMDSGKSYIIAKMRYDIESRNEYEMQKLAYEYSLELNNGVKVPEVLDEFVHGENGYMLMEYIDGKTLFNLLNESISKQLIIPEIKKHINNPSSFNYKIDEEVSSFEDIYGKMSDFDFITDEDSLAGLNHLIGILHGFGDYRFSSNLSSYTGIKGNNIVLFDNKQGEELNNSLSVFFKYIHNKGLYHRDIGDNFRNIMLSIDDDGNYIPHIIDFGKSINNSSSSDAYIDFDNNLKFINDLSLLSVIKNITGEVTKKETVDINKVTTIKGAFMACIKGKNKLSGYFKLNTQRGKVHQESMESRAKLEKLTNNLNEEEKILLLSFFEEELEKTSNNKDITYKYAEVFLTYIGFDINDYF